MFNVGILGGTGIVGQKLISLLINHPFFRVHSISASSKNVGKKYSTLCQTNSTEIGNLILKPAIPTFFGDCHFIFSCLQSDVSAEIEKTFLEYGFLIFSNCYNYRLHPLVPLVVPTVNSYILDNFHPKDGLNIITNANCSTTGIVTILYPLDLEFGIKRVSVTTLQSISGAGKYFDENVTGNIIPFIKSEEEKITSETLKILAKNVNDFKISATCNRVPVQNGHTVCMSIEFEYVPTIAEIIDCLQSYDNYLCDHVLNTPTGSDKTFIKILLQDDRPQPLLDVDKSNGFCVSVGRIRKCNVFHIKLTLHFNNVVLGAAGSALLNAEVYFKKINSMNLNEKTQP